MPVAYSYSSVSDRLLRLGESQTIEMSRKARQLSLLGKKIYNLSLGEPDFSTPQYIKDSAREAISEGNSWYTPVAGTYELRQAIQEKLQQENGIGCSIENIVVSNGAKQALANVILALVNPGDEVVVFSPYWLTYEELVRFAGGKLVLLKGKSKKSFKATAEELEEAITDSTRLIIFSSPCNPSGAIFSQQELVEIAKVVARHRKVIILADEVYEYIRFQEEFFSIGSLESIKDQVVTVNGFSKGFAMTGWRVGYIAAPDWIAKACEKLQGQLTSGASSVSQKAATAALLGCKQPVFDMTKAYLRRRNLAVEILRQIPGLQVPVPEGTFFLMPEVSYYLGKEANGKIFHTAQELCKWMLSETHVCMVTGAPFGEPNRIRISFAVSDDCLKEALSLIKDAFIKLNQQMKNGE